VHSNLNFMSKTSVSSSERGFRAFSAFENRIDKRHKTAFVF